MKAKRSTTLAGVASLAAALTVSACSSSAHSAGTPTTAPASGSVAPASTQPQRVVLRTASVSGVGTVIVAPNGLTLYAFAPDDRKAVTCTGGCAGVWPPLTVTATPTAGTGVTGSLIGTISGPGGKLYATYGGWPLYTYADDSGPGEATGEGIDSYGGTWSALTPAGTMVASAGSGGSQPAPTTSTGGSGGY